ncbi:GGDEF domain-containing protein [Paracoccus aminophilus]|uniref:diguanylate cyclase n=1 Tax=Paracoccus aminophilus JCM 7686 TaxID=1367847 RepID=S5XVU8_PARAH|nr:GGDEF domain-containing protein [Paracoccus aminophilus]AGT09407.1 diguanylate cyclase [Paracoccus aminophilus JCM 7686]
MIHPEFIHTTSVSLLLPMSLHLSPEGEILTTGPTLRRLIGNARHFDMAFSIDRPRQITTGFSGLHPVLQEGGRIFLRLTAHPETIIRGHGILMGNGAALLNFGFGVGLSDAVRNFKLSDADFAPSDLALELLFLHEANVAVQGELSRFNLNLEEARKAAEVQAYTDPLTGLYNRRGLDVALGTALREAEKLPFAVGHVDLDHFKEANDQYGHAAGDLVLQRVAKILREETRSCDTAARVGGDEFVLILPSPGASPNLLKLARRIITRIEEGVCFEGQQLHVSASIGFSESSFYASPESARMLADADTALYQAKKEGRARAVLYGRSRDLEGSFSEPRPQI